MKRHLGTRGRRSRGIRYTQQRLEELAAMGVLATDGPGRFGSRLLAHQPLPGTSPRPASRVRARRSLEAGL